MTEVHTKRDLRTDSEESTLDDLAASLTEYADLISPAVPDAIRAQAVERYRDMSVALRQSAKVVRHHAKCKKVHQQLKIAGALAAALFAVATALVGQSSGWADKNIGLAYGLLIGGTIVAAIAGAFAVYLGATDPTKLT